MPHSTSTAVNGDSPDLRTSSTFLNHLTSYPLIHDALTTLSTHSLTSKPIHLGSDIYARVSQPLAPYLQGPYSYARPYVARADELADSGLQRVETSFPIVKEDTDVLVRQGRDLLLTPLRVAGEGRDYVVGTWNDEYKKTLSHSASSQRTLQVSVLALVATELKFASDFFQAVADVLAQQSRSQREQHGADAPTTKLNGRLAHRLGGASEAARGLQEKVVKGQFGRGSANGNGSVADQVKDKADEAGEKVKEGAEEVREKAQQQ